MQNAGLLNSESSLWPWKSETLETVNEILCCALYVNVLMGLLVSGQHSDNHQNNLNY